MNTTQFQAMVQKALEDAARRTQRDVATLEVQQAEAVTWPDGSLGCPQLGMMYTQALVRGYRIRIRAGKEILEYHAAASGQPFYCPRDRIAEPVPDPRV